MICNTRRIQLIDFNHHFDVFYSRKRPRRVLSKKALPLKTVIKDCPKFCWIDGCPSRSSSKTAQSSAEKMAVFTDCHQRLPKVLLNWWLSLKIVIKDCPKFCWRDGCLHRLLKRWLSLQIVIKDCPKFCWSDDCVQRLEKRLQIFD